MLYLPEDVYGRLRVSFGAWTMLASMMSPNEFLNLQALCTYCYDVSISRVQCRFGLPDNSHQVLARVGVLVHKGGKGCKLYKRSTGQALKYQEWSHLGDYRACFNYATQAIIGDHLLILGKVNDRLSVLKFEIPTNKAFFREVIRDVVETQSFPVMQWAQTII